MMTKSHFCKPESDQLKVISKEKDKLSFHLLNKSEPTKKSLLDSNPNLQLCRPMVQPGQSLLKMREEESKLWSLILPEQEISSHNLNKPLSKKEQPLLKPDLSLLELKVATFQPN
jgi:hypothetical protein